MADFHPLPAFAFPPEICEINPNEPLGESTDIGAPVGTDGRPTVLWYGKGHSTINSKTYCAQTWVEVDATEKLDLIFRVDDWGIFYIDCNVIGRADLYNDFHTTQTLSAGKHHLFVIWQNAGGSATVQEHPCYFRIEARKGGNMIYESRAANWRGMELTAAKLQDFLNSRTTTPKPTTTTTKRPTTTLPPEPPPDEGLVDCAKLLFGGNFHIPPSTTPKPTTTTTTTTTTKKPTTTTPKPEAVVCGCMHAAPDYRRDYYAELVSKLTIPESKVMGFVTYELVFKNHNCTLYCSAGYSTIAERDAIRNYTQKLAQETGTFGFGTHSEYLKQYTTTLAQLKSLFNNKKSCSDESKVNTHNINNYCHFYVAKGSINLGTEEWIWPKKKVCNQNPTGKVYETVVRDLRVLHVQPDLYNAVENRHYLVMTTLDVPETGDYEIAIIGDDDHEFYINCKLISQGPFIGDKYYPPKTVSLTKGPTQFIIRYKNIPDKTPGYCNMRVYKNGTLLYEGRAADFKGQENAIGEIKEE